MLMLVMSCVVYSTALHTVYLKRMYMLGKTNLLLLCDKNKLFLCLNVFLETDVKQIFHIRFSFFSMLELAFCCADIQHLGRFLLFKRLEVVFAKTAVNSETMHLLRTGGWLDDTLSLHQLQYVLIKCIKPFNFKPGKNDKPMLISHICSGHGCSFARSLHEGKGQM